MREPNLAAGVDSTYMGDALERLVWRSEAWVAPACQLSRKLHAKNRGWTGGEALFVVIPPDLQPLDGAIQRPLVCVGEAQWLKSLGAPGSWSKNNNDRHDSCSFFSSWGIFTSLTL